MLRNTYRIDLATLTRLGFGVLLALSFTGAHGQEEEQNRAAEPAPKPEAENNADAPSRVIEEILVTAQKREQALGDVPMAITALSGQLLEDMGAQSLQDIAHATPSLSVIETGPGLQNIQMRGISTNFNKATVGYQLDSVSLTSFALTQPDAATYDLAGVEVLRGPQGTLYGEGSMGGTIKLISQAPKLGVWEAAWQASHEITEDGDPSTEFDAVVNLPVGDASAFRLVGSRGKTGGYIDLVNQNQPRANDASRQNGRLRYSWTPSEQWSFDAMYMLASTEAGSSNAGDANYQNTDRAEQGIDDLMRLYSLDIQWQSDFADVTLNTGYFDRDLIFDFDARSTYEVTVGNAIPSLRDLLEPLTGELLQAVPARIITRTKTLVTELRASSSHGGKLYWIAGLYARDFREDQGNDTNIENASLGVPLRVPLQDYIYHSESRSYSGFGQVEMDWLPWFNTAIGARWYREKLDTDAEGQLAQQSIDNVDEATYTAFTPRFTASFRPGADWWGWVDENMFYVSVAKGFRSGGANLRFSEGSVASEASSGVPAIYEPDFLTSYELGGKLVFAEGLLTAEMAVFYNDWEQIQQLTFGDTFSYIANVGNAEGLGIEWNFLYVPIKSLQLSLSGSYIDTEFVTNSGSKQEGDPVDAVPPLSVALGASYSFDWWQNYPGMARLDYNYVDSSQYLDRGLGFDYTSDAIRFLNMRLGLERESFQIYLFGKNVLDERIAMDANRPEWQTRSRPRSIGVELKMNFE